MKNLNPSPSVYDTTIRLLILLLIIVWCLMILSPFVNILLWSLIFALAFHPLHKKLVTWMGGKRRLASLIIVLLCLAIIIIPSWFFLDAIVKEIKELKDSFQAGNLTIPPPSE